MIGFLVRTLTGTSVAGAFGPWLLLGAVVAIGGAGFVSGNYVRGVTDAPVIANLKTDYANCRAAWSKQRADGAEKVIGALTASAANVTAAMNTLVAKATARGKSLDQFLKELENAPPSKVCGTVAAELAFRRSVQQPAVAP